VAFTVDEELKTLAALLNRVREKDHELRSRDWTNVPSEIRLALSRQSQETLRILYELRSRSYGKAVKLRKVQTGAIQTLRVAQANYGFPDIGVLNRLSEVGRRLVTASAGDEVHLPAGLFEVVQVTHLEPPPPNVDQVPDFRSVDIEALEFDEAFPEARATLRRLVEHLLDDAASCSDQAFDFAGPRLDVVRADEAALSSRFYTRTTDLQEALLQRDSYGLVVVHGVAGSGKTSVALGRTKVLCDRGPEQGEDEPDFFRPETAVGFVLSSQLSVYLKKACGHLSLFDMPIREYHEFRTQLVQLRRLDEEEGFRGGAPHGEPAEREPLAGRIGWFHATERAIARRLAVSLRSAVAEPPGEGVARRGTARTTEPRTSEQVEALAEIWARLREDVELIAASLERQNDNSPTLRLVKRLDECRERFATALESNPHWTGSGGRRGDDVSHKRALRQNVRNALRDRLIRALRLPQAYADAVRDQSFDADVRRHVSAEAGAIADAVAAARSRLASQRLADEDLDVLLSVAHQMSVGYQGRDDKDPISQLAEMTYHSQVFIDEYQDFSEVQLFLMGQAADPRRHAVTVVGDLCQRLSRRVAPELGTCFPNATADEATPQVLLRNLRQSARLGYMSHLTREFVLGEPHVDLPFGEDGEPGTFVVAPPEELANAVYEAVVAVPRHQSVAVLCPSRQVAEQLQGELREDLRETYRDSLVSAHADLVRRFYVHFTTPLDAKGLEFDAVVVASVEGYDLSDPVGANSFYVAVSRPRESLVMIGQATALAGSLAEVVRRACVPVLQFRST